MESSTLDPTEEIILESLVAQAAESYALKRYDPNVEHTLLTCELIGLERQALRTLTERGFMEDSRTRKQSHVFIYRSNGTTITITKPSHLYEEVYTILISGRHRRNVDETLSFTDKKIFLETLDEVARIDYTSIT